MLYGPSDQGTVCTNITLMTLRHVFK